MYANSHETLEKERLSIVQSGKLHWIHWGVILGSLLLTIIAWDFSKDQVLKNNNTQFEYAASQIRDLTIERMQKYEDGLLGGVAAMNLSGGQMLSDGWKSYAETLKINDRYPGINGIGVIYHIQPDQLAKFVERHQASNSSFAVFPEHEKPDHFPIVFIEPLDENIQALGLDIAYEERRYEAALKAGETGLSQITAPIRLVQDASSTPGFLFYAPFYKETNQEGERQFSGMVYAPFVFHKLIEGVLGKDSRQVRFSIRDGADILYDERTLEQEELPNDQFSISYSVPLYGRVWTFDIWLPPGAQKNIEGNEPTIILACGILLEVTLFSMFVLLTQSNRRALRFADRTTQKLRLQAEALIKSNSDLEKFAYITSHDLKTPLRGMGDLAEYIEEDLSSYLRSPDANPRVSHNISRMYDQVSRMDNLIKGILEYSAIGQRGGRCNVVDISEMVSAIRGDLSLRPEQVLTVGSFPLITTDELRLNQVLANLIGNAVKYHHCVEKAEIVVRVEEEETRLIITVSDNGPGIDGKFHSRIFEPFQTLQPKDKIESTGIGLSIVKKSVENFGGMISVKSSPGEGTAVRFDWPKVLDADLIQEAA